MYEIPSLTSPYTTSDGQPTPQLRTLAKVLDYYLIIEFLSQGSFPITPKDVANCEDYLCKITGVSRQDQPPKKVDVSLISRPDRGEDLFTLIDRTKRRLDFLPLCGRLTIYGGQVRRIYCINALSQIMKLSDEKLELRQPADAEQTVALFSLQLEADGTYVPGSISVSPIVWKVARLDAELQGKKSKANDSEGYHDLVNYLDDECRDPAHSKHLSAATPPDAGPAPAKFTQLTLRKLYDLLCRNLLKPLADKSSAQNLGDADPPYFEYYAASLRLCREQTAAEAHSAPYRGLHESYFTSDLQLLRSRIEALRKSPAFLASYNKQYNAPPAFITRYLISDSAPLSARLNVFPPHALQQTPGTCMRLFNLLLNPACSPLGKWPSPHRPALMQQIAINLSVPYSQAQSDLKKARLGEMTQLLSVNGPPGTGKTTLLKEIIAGNVVERAVLLSDFKDPKSAFAPHDYKPGSDITGKEPKPPGDGEPSTKEAWYSLKENTAGPSLPDFGMLVACSNNNAAENISRELPVDAYLASFARDTLATFGLDPKLDVYFTSAARNMLISSGTKDPQATADEESAPPQPEIKDAQVWGLVSAALGKQENVNAFYYDVLKGLLNTLFDSTKSSEQRGELKKHYSRVRDIFREQYQKVRQIRNSLAAPAAARERHFKLEAELSPRLRSLAEKIELQRKKLTSARERADAVMKRLPAAQRDAVRRLGTEGCLECEHECKQELRSLRERQTYLDSAWPQPSSISWPRTIFLALTLRLAAAKRRAAAAFDEAVRLHQQRLDEIADCMKANQALLTALAATAKACEAVSCQEEALQAAQKQMADCKSKLEQSQNALGAALAAFRKNHPDTPLLDEDYLASLSDPAEAALFQSANPWLTDEYDRARERLFILALQLHQAFIFACPPIRQNLVVLSHLLGLRTIPDKRVLTEKQRSAIAPSLFQTLLLLVPVISSTFASTGRLFKDVTDPGVFGELIIDEAGQTPPQHALGAMFRCRRVLAVGDPLQLEPVVTGELDLLRDKFATDPDLYPFTSKTCSVQSFTDRANPFGTYLHEHSGSAEPLWVGTPLSVHRRCISPMFDISNELSYGGFMQNCTTAPDKALVYRLAPDLPSSWLDVVGTAETGHARGGASKSHFVPAQAEAAARLLGIIFRAWRRGGDDCTYPDVFIITPFKSVSDGLLHFFDNSDTSRTAAASTWLEDDELAYLTDNKAKRIGTVHTFQGREADQVLLLLGCDSTAAGAVSWLANNPNLINVAVTRARYRLYVIGDAEVFSPDSQNGRATVCPPVALMRSRLMTIGIERLQALLNAGSAGNNDTHQLADAAASLPPGTSLSSPLTSQTDKDLGEAEDFRIHTTDFAAALKNLLGGQLSAEELTRFGFSSQREVEALITPSPTVKTQDYDTKNLRLNLVLGIKLYNLLDRLHTALQDFDASCCGILFCKAMELHLRQNLLTVLKAHRDLKSLNVRVGGRTSPLSAVKARNFTLGTFHTIITDHGESLAALSSHPAGAVGDYVWWSDLANHLRSFTEKRNECCHHRKFNWEDLESLLNLMFSPDGGPENRTPSLLETISRIPEVLPTS